MIEKNNPLYIVTIPMNKPADFIKEMDFFNLFQSHFVGVYGLELSVNVIVSDSGEETCEIVFKGVEEAIQAVIEVLKEMGLSPAFEHDYSKYIDGEDPNDYH